MTTDPGEWWREARLDAIAAVGAALAGDWAGYRQIHPPDSEYTDGHAEALITIAAYAIMDAAAAKNITTTEYLAELTNWANTQNNPEPGE